MTPLGHYSNRQKVKTFEASTTQLFLLPNIVTLLEERGSVPSSRHPSQFLLLQNMFFYDLLVIMSHSKPSTYVGKTRLELLLISRTWRLE